MPRSRNFLLASLMLAASCACARLDAQVTATLTVNGSEPSTSPTTGSIAVSFNGFIEIVNYGQYSTNASLAAGLAAQFSRDYYAYGLGAHASSTGANFVPANANVIYFSLPAGQTFGSIDYTLPNSPFSLVPSGFGTTAPLLADTGTVTLSVQGSPIATANYGDGTTPSEIAQKLQDSACTPPAGTVWTFCSPFNPSSPVTLQAVGESLYLTASQPGTSGDISYSIAVAHDTADFPNPSFEFTPSAGLLSGGDAAGPIAPSTVYSYKVETAGGASGYAVNGDLLNLQDSVMGSWQYTYDNLNRLVGASQSGVALANLYPNPSLCWSYDNAGNRLAQAIANQPIAAGTCNLPTGTGAAGSQQLTTYVGESSGATSNRIATIALPGQSVATVQYDGFATPAPGPGNITFDGTNTYLYDLEDRVCAVHGPYGMIGYQYDAEGNRIGKGSITTMSCDITANGYQPQSDYILDQGGDQVTELAVDAIGTEVWQHTNVWADGQLIATYDTAGQHFYFNDALGTRRYQTDASGALEQTCQSLPFGDFLNCTGSNTAPTEHHFTGKERDVESGLDYFMARYYASSTGRFMSPDWSVKEEPVPYAQADDPQSLNLYQYVRNNPLGMIDPDGHGWWSDFGNGVADATYRPAVQALTHPVNTVVGVGHAIAHPLSTAIAVKDGVVRTAIAASHGDGHAIGVAAGTIAVSLAPGIGEAGDAVEASEDLSKVSQLTGEAGEAGRAGQVTEQSGVIYRRTNPETGEEYIGQAKSMSRYEARQGEHDAALGVKHDYKVLERGKPGTDLDVREETHIRNGGGPSKKGGNLANKRYQMSEKRYRAAGGTANKPTP